MSHEGYHKIETGMKDDWTSQVEGAIERIDWRKKMGFPEPDAGTNLGPPSVNENAMYYLARIEGQFFRLEELLPHLSMPASDLHELRKFIYIQNEFLASLRDTLNAA